MNLTPIIQSMRTAQGNSYVAQEVEAYDAMSVQAAHVIAPQVKGFEQWQGHFPTWLAASNDELAQRFRLGEPEYVYAAVATLRGAPMRLRNKMIYGGGGWGNPLFRLLRLELSGVAKAIGAGRLRGRDGVQALANGIAGGVVAANGPAVWRATFGEPPGRGTPAEAALRGHVAGIDMLPAAMLGKVHEVLDYVIVPSELLESEQTVRNMRAVAGMINA